MRGPRRRIRLWLAVSSFCLLPVAPAVGEPVTLASGPAQGAYYRLAGAIRDRLAKEQDEITVEIRTSLDCAENLQLLEDGEARFALAQQDVASDYFRKHPNTRLRVVDRLFYDYLHIFLRESVHIDSPADLRQLRIWVGEDETGTRFTASRFLDSLGIPLATLERRLVTGPAPSVTDPWAGERFVASLPKLFGDDRLDAAILLATPGSESVCGLMLHGRCSLLSFDRRMLRRLAHEEESAKQKGIPRQIVIGSIPAGTYANQPEPVTTIAVPVLLLAAEGEDAAKATKLRDAAVQAWQEMASQKNGCSFVPAPEAAEPLALPESRLLPDVPRPKPGRPLSTWIVLAVAFIFPAGTGVLFYHAPNLRRRLGWLWKVAWTHYRSLCGIVAILVVCVPLITAGTYYTENEINESFSSIVESFWSITIYFFSGLEDRVPFTLTGRIFVTFGLVIGAVCSTIAAAWINRAIIRKERTMPGNMTDHYLILNWNERGLALLRELHDPVLQRRKRTRGFVVLTADENATLRQLSPGLGREDPEGIYGSIEIYPRLGDPTDKAALLSARAEHARTVIILADEARGDEATIRSIAQLCEVACASKRKDHHIVAELIDPANEQVLKHLAAGFPGLIESVSGPRLRTCLLAQAALTEGITGFYTDLLSIKADSNEVYAEPIPAEAAGKSFREYAELVIKQSNPESPMIPVGIYRIVDGKAKVCTNPKGQSKEAVLQKGDKLVVIAYGPPAANALPVPESGA